MRPVLVESLRVVLPQIAVSTDDLEGALSPTLERLGIPRGQIEALTGVRERRFWPDTTRPWHMAAEAAALAMAEAGRSPEQIDVLVSTSVCRDGLEPSMASSIHGRLGLPARCLNFDVGNACLGFLTGLDVVAALIASGQARAGLVVAGEGSREVVEATAARLGRPDTDRARFSSELATLTLGSAAVAALVVSGDLARGGHTLLSGVSVADTAANHLCQGDATGMHTDGPALLEAGVALARRTLAEARRQAWGVDDAAIFAMHQVGRTHHATIIRALGLDEARCPAIYPSLGNVGAAGVPVTLAASASALRRGDTVALMGIGSGLNCAMRGLRWG